MLQAATRDRSPMTDDPTRQAADAGRHHAVMRALTDHAIIVTDPQGIVTDWNAGAERLFGLGADEARGRTVDIIFTADDRQAGVPTEERALALSAGRAEDERWHVRADGTCFWGSGLMTPLAGTPEGGGFLKILRDQTEARRTQAALRESEARLRGFAENSADTLWILDGTSRHLNYLSPAFERMFGETRKTVMADFGRWAELVHPDDSAIYSSFLRRCIAGETSVAHYRVVRPSDGTIVWLRDTGFPVRDPAGGIRNAAGIVQDVTDIHQATEVLSLEKERFRSLAEGIPMLVWRSLREGHWTWASPQWLAFTGQSLEESLGRGWLDAVHPDDRAASLHAWHRASLEGVLDLEHRLRRAGSGEYRWFHTRAVPALATPDAPGRDAGTEWLGTTADIDDLKRLQGQQAVLLAELQHRTRNLLGVIRATASRSLEPSPGGDRFLQRLATISRVQAFLSGSPTWSVGLSELVRTELDAAGAGGRSRLTISGPDIELPGETIQVVALVIHELATNAVKYGALAADALDTSPSFGASSRAGPARTSSSTGVRLASRCHPPPSRSAAATVANSSSGRCPTSSAPSPASPSHRTACIAPSSFPPEPSASPRERHDPDRDPEFRRPPHPGRRGRVHDGRRGHPRP